MRLRYNKSTSIFSQHFCVCEGCGASGLSPDSFFLRCAHKITKTDFHLRHGWLSVSVCPLETPRLALDEFS